jgi:hypothetical protein
MKVALYRHTRFGGVSPSEFEDGAFPDNSRDYVRVSEVVDVDFPMLSRDKVVVQQVQQLEEERDSILAEAQAKATRIDSQIANLLALPYGGES